MYFKDRRDAGLQLALKLISYKNDPLAIILALPRGGVVTAFEVAQQLNLPLDIICARKIGAPDNPEFAIGAITETGHGYLNKELISTLEVRPDYLKMIIEQETNEAQRRLKTYRPYRATLNLKNKSVVLVDDGMATGATMKAAIAAVKSANALKIIVAIPVSSYETFEEIKQEVDEVIALALPIPFYSVGEFYQNFSQTTDGEVIKLLSQFSQN